MQNSLQQRRAWERVPKLKCPHYKVYIRSRTDRFFTWSCSWVLLLAATPALPEATQSVPHPVPTSAPWRMDGQWTSNTFLLGLISVANHGSSVAVSLLTYQSGASIRICTKPLPGMRLGIKVDNSDYQKIKYLVIIYNHDSDFFWKSHITY